jgi:DNA-binding protein H-NS
VRQITCRLGFKQPHGTTMRKPDLNALEFEELWDLHRQLTEILADKIVVEKRELEARLEKLNRVEIIRDVESTHHHPEPRRKYPTVLPKYRNPLAPSQTWSGRGKRPRWFVAALETGHRPDDLKIDRDGKNARKHRSSASRRH